jgi:phosphoribosylglycinamide formyltransferase 1
MGTRIAVLASGVGSNLQALLDDAVVGPRVVLVVADRQRAEALNRAKAAGVPSAFLDPHVRGAAAPFDDRLLDLLTTHRIDTLVTAGFMRILAPRIVRAFEGRCLNIHPSLLPSFPGAHAIADSLAWGVKVTGVTVHLIDDQVDHGPIVTQEAVSVLDDDDERTLRARIQEVEHRLYKQAVRALIENRVRVDGRRVTIAGAAP